MEDGRHILSNVVSTQIAIHAPYGGVVPELASRHHLENICPVIEKAMADAGVDVRGPGRGGGDAGPGPRGLAARRRAGGQGHRVVHGKPLVPVHHIAGHIEAPFLAHEDVAAARARARRLRRAHEPLRGARRAATTACSAARATTPRARPSTRWPSCWASAIPAGRSSTGSREGANDRAHEFTIAKLKDGSADFSFSGIKTAVLYHVRRAGIAPVAEPATPPRPRSATSSPRSSARW